MSLIEEFWNDIFILSGNLTLFIRILTVLCAIYFIKYWNEDIRFFFFYILFSVVLNFLEQVFIWVTDVFKDSITPFLLYWEISDTFFLQIFLYLNNYLLLGIFYSRISPIKSYGSLLRWLSIILALLTIVNFFFFDGYKKHGLLSASLIVIFVFVVPLIYLWQSQKYSLRIPLWKNPYFWISLGLVIPNLLSSFLYFTGDNIYSYDYVVYVQMYCAKNFFTMFGQLMIAIGFAHSYYARFIQTTEA